MHVRGCHRPPPMFKEKSFQFDIDYFFYSTFKQSVFSGQDVYNVVLKGMIFLLQM